jgi:YD repeat-containing protein
MAILIKGIFAGLLLGGLSAQPALALPAPLLGPDGAFWVGTLHPASPQHLQANREWVMVNPHNGDLRVEAIDFKTSNGAPMAFGRTYQNEQWRFSFEENQALKNLKVQKEGDQIVQIRDKEGRSLQLRYDGAGKVSVVRSDTGRECYYDHQQGQLIAVSCNNSTRTRYLYSPQNTLKGLLWADGSMLRVNRNAKGQIDEMIGPGSQVQRYTWLKIGLSIHEEDGSTHRVLFSQSGYSIQNPQGQSVSVQLKEDQIQSWKDPAGVETRLSHNADGRIVGVEIGGIGQWRLGWQRDNLTRVEDPTGAAWTYARTDDGALAGLQSPSGIKRQFSRDIQGRIRSIETSSGSLRFTRDNRGKITRIQRPSGAEIHLNRDGQGRIVSMVDPAGGKIALARTRLGAISAITERSGEVWKIQHDTLGRTRGLSTPSGGQLNWRRTSQGRIAHLSMSEDRALDYATNSPGLPTQIKSSSGATRGMQWNSARLLTRIYLEDKTTLQLGRDAKGRLNQVTFNEKKWDIQRNSQGFPISVGPLQFDWGTNGAWHSIQAPGFQLQLDRGFGGNIRKLSYGDTSIALTRDSSGRVVRILQDNQPILLQRDANGLVVGMQSQGRTWEFRRDARSLLSQTHQGTVDQRRLYDPAGRTLKVFSPESSGLSAQYDNEGRFSMLRFPSGNISRFGYGPATQFQLFENAAGTTLLSRQVTRDTQGRIQESKSADSVQRIHRDPRGQVVSTEDGQSAWSWMPGLVEGPDEYLLQLNAENRPTTLRLPISTQAWGGQPTRANYTLKQGQIESLALNEVQLDFQLDALGRPVAVDASDGRWWRLHWDALGRLSHVEDDSGSTQLFFGLNQWIRQTKGESDTPFLHLSNWGSARLGTNPASWMMDEQGNTRLLYTKNHNQLVDWTPLKQASKAVGPLRDKGRWAGLNGGLVFDTEGATESLSGQRLQHQWRPPWKGLAQDAPAWSPLDGSRISWWAPDPWQAENTFDNPLHLLVSLNQIDPRLGAEWTNPESPVPPLPWLPPSASTQTPPLGPPQTSLPLDLSPLELLCLQAVLGPVFPLDSRSIGLALLEPEFQDLPSLNWLGEEGWTWWLMGAEHWLELP